MKKLLFSGLILLSCLAHAERKYGDYLVNDPTLSYNKNSDLNLSNWGIKYFSAQAIYSSATISVMTFDDGSAATGTITVLSTSSLVATQGTNTIRISTAGATGAVITLNGRAFTEGTDWGIFDVSTTAALSLVNAFNSGNYGVTASTTVMGANASTVTLTCNGAGAFCNSWTLTSSTPTAITIGGATFSGGLDDATIIINTERLIRGRDWSVGATSSATAKNISDAIMANTTLNAALVSTWTAAAVVPTTATASGTAVNSYTFSSNTSSITVSGFSGGTVSDVSTANDTIYVPAHGISTGYPVWFQTVSGSAPSLVTGTTYYAIKSDANYLKMASSSVNAIAGTAVDISSQTAQGGGSFKLNPTAFAGSWGIRWQASNDGTNFYALSVTTVTYSTPSNYLWDFGRVTYKWIRCIFDAGTGGGMNLKVIGEGQ